MVAEHKGTEPQALGALPVAVSGRFTKSNEEDTYELTVEPESEVNIDVEADSLGSPIDAQLELRDAKGTKLATADDSPTGPDPSLTYKVPKGVTKIIAAVRDGNGHTGPRAIYRLVATTKGKENPAGFTLKIAADNCTLAPGGPNVFKVEAERAGYDGPIDLSFDHLPPGVKVTGQSMPAEATATLITLTSDVPLPELISGVKGRGKNGEITASVDSPELSRFQPWLAQSFAMVGVAKSDVAFSVGWGAAVADRKVPLGGKVMLPVTCSRPAGHDGPVRLTLLTSEAKKFVKQGAQDTINLREEKPVLIEEDKTAQAAYNNMAAAEAALTAAQKAASATKDETAAGEAAKKVEAAQTMMENAKKAAEEAAQKAKNDVDFAMLVPAELPMIPHQIAFKAELLKRDRRTVEAVAYTTVRDIPVINPLELKFDQPAPIKLASKKAATDVEIAGKLERLEGAAGDVALTVEGLPSGVPAPAPVTLKAGVTDFKFTLKVPATLKPGEYAGAKIVATGKPFGTQQVRSADHPVTLNVLAPEPDKPKEATADTSKQAAPPGPSSPAEPSTAAPPAKP
jgi:hypothetical protein